MVTRFIGPIPIFPAATPKKLYSVLPPPDPSEEADRGLVVIEGSAGQVINLNHSYSANASWSVMQEVQRTSDDVRIKNPDDPAQNVKARRPRKVDVEQNNSRRGVPDGGVRQAGPASQTIEYAKQPPQDNIEVEEENIVDKNPEYDAGGGGSAAP